MLADVPPDPTGWIPVKRSFHHNRRSPGLRDYQLSDRPYPNVVGTMLRAVRLQRYTVRHDVFNFKLHSFFDRNPVDDNVLRGTIVQPW